MAHTHPRLGLQSANSTTTRPRNTNVHKGPMKNTKQARADAMKLLSTAAEAQGLTATLENTATTDMPIIVLRSKGIMLTCIHYRAGAGKHGTVDYERLTFEHAVRIAHLILFTYWAHRDAISPTTGAGKRASARKRT